MNDSSLFNRGAALVLSLFVLISSAQAALITSNLGNTSTGFISGNSYTLFPEIVGAQIAQPAPFNQGYGNELLANPGAVSWTHNYSAINMPIVDATLTFGIWDHDTAALGSQLEGFLLGGVDKTAELDSLFEVNGGVGDAVFSTYEISLDAILFADIADGNFSVDLDIGGFGLQTALPFLGGGISDTANNAFHLIYSSLEVNTREGNPNPTPTPNPIPEPSTLLLLLGSFIVLRSKLQGL